MATQGTQNTQIHLQGHLQGVNMLIAGEPLAAIDVIEDSGQQEQPRSSGGVGMRKCGRSNAGSTARTAWTGRIRTAPGSLRHSCRDLAAEAARRSPKARQGASQRRARGATHTVVRRTGAQKIVENVTYFEYSQKERFWGPNQGAPNVTHSEEFGT